MEGKRKDFFKKRPNSHFKKKGFNNKTQRLSSSNHERPSSGDDPAETVYRILCPMNKIGGVIGKGGGRIKALREETKAKITVSDSVPGSDERVITIYSSGANILKRHNTDDEKPGEDDNVDNMEPHCAAQEALLKVHERIVEEELFGGMTFDDENENSTVTVRLLVPSNMVGCLIGKGGDIIQRLRSETGAGIRVLPPDHLPTCAMSTDELVQISAKSDVAKRALYQISTLLHKNPRKDEPPPKFPPPHAGQGFPRSNGPMPHMLHPGMPMLSHRHSDPFGMPPSPWMGDYGSPRARFPPGGYNGVAPDPVMKAAGEFSMKILCSSAKIGVVIGKGGYHVKQLQQETGASIQVEDPSEENGERVIRVYAVEDAGNPRSQTIDAILQLQNETSELTVEGTITTRLLVPSAKVGCIIGQGGQIINEMRKRSRADIRVISKDERPKCASEEEELVQISGNPGVARDALGEISSRLRARILRDAPPAPPPPSLASEGRLPPLRPNHPPGMVGMGRTGGYESYKVGVHEFEPRGYPGPPVDAGFLPSNSGIQVAAHEYDPPSYLAPRAAPRYPEVSSDFEARIANKLVSSSMGIGRSSFPDHGEFSGRRLEHPDHHPGAPDSVLYNPYATPSGPTQHTSQGPPHPNMVSQQESRQSPYVPQHGLYPPDHHSNTAAAPPPAASATQFSAYHYQDSSAHYQGSGAQPGSYQY